MPKNNLQKNKGFTIVETLVAISILSISILATFTAVQSGLSKSNMAKDQITAYYLIQEAMEFIRNIRDQNQLMTIGGTPTNWLAGISNVNTDPCWYGNYCYIDSPAKTITACSTPADFTTCPYLKQDPATGLYNYTTGSNSRFRREIQIQSIDPLKEVIVTVKVDWSNGKSVQVKEWFYNLR